MGAWDTERSISANRLRNGVTGGLGIVFPFGGALADATVFRDGAGVRLVRPMPLANLYAEDSTVQVFAHRAVHFCF